MEKIPDKGDLKYFKTVSWNSKLIILKKKKIRKTRKQITGGRKSSENWAALYRHRCIIHFQ